MENSSSDQPQLPLGNSDSTEKATHYSDWDPKDVERELEERRREGGAHGELGGRAVSEEVELEEEKPHEVPKTEEGLYDLDQLEPGMFMPEWGPVRGSRSYSGLDFINYPNKFTIGERRFHAALEFAKRENAHTRAIESGDEEKARTAGEKVRSWVKYSREQNWIK